MIEKDPVAIPPKTDRPFPTCYLHAGMACLSTWTTKTGRTLGVLLGTALGSGCGGAQSDIVEGREGLPAWDAAARQTFDDDIEPPTLVGDTNRARLDPVLRERARTAELVGRMRVTTVTAESLDGIATYRIVVQMMSAPFITPRISGTSWELVVGPKAPAHGLMRAFDTRLRGASFIGFLRRFVGEGGEPELHWHLSPDSTDVAAAVGGALGLAELSGQ